MLKKVIIFIGIIELLIGIINSFRSSRNRNTSKKSLENEVSNVTKEKNKVNINELMSLEGVTYIFLASVAIRTNMNNIIVIILFIIIQGVFGSILFKTLKRGSNGR